jgi:hypothetical protein
MSNKKTCTKCNEEKSLDCFDKHPKSKDGLSPKCKECRKDYWQEYISKPENRKKHREKSRKRATINRQKIFEFVRKLKEGQPCTDCGNSYPYYVMHYDHLGDKEECVSILKAQGATKKRILKEIEKCELVCANCHAERTHQRRIES